MFRIITFTGSNKELGEHLQFIQSVLEIRPTITLGEMRTIMNAK